MAEHPNRQLLVALARAVSPELRDSVLVHVGECSECAELLGRAAVEVAVAESERKVIDFERSNERARMSPPTSARTWWARPRSSAAELTAAETTVEEILAQPESQRPLLVQNTDRYRSLAVAEVMLERAREQCYDEPPAGIVLAELGLSILDRLDREYYGRRMLDDVCGRGWSYIGNAFRILDRPQRAADAFQRAADLLEGSPEPQERACLFSLWSSLHRDGLEFDSAIDLLTRAIDLYEEVGEEGKAGRAFVSLGNVYGELFEPEEAERVYAEALVRLDASEDPRSLLYARHGLVVTLTEQERYHEAAELLAEIEPEYERFSDSHTQLAVRWLRGRIAAGLGRDDEAEPQLEAVRQRFMELGSSLNAAQVSLHLAQLYERQKRSRELRELAEEMTPFFFSRDLGRETALALSFFVRAVEQERASAVVIRRVAGFVQRSQHEPELRFSDFN